jgi:hypothetical protein
MLEELELIEHDGVGNNYKSFLVQLRAWMDCDRCATPRATSMLLVLVLERLSIRLEKGVEGRVRGRLQVKRAVIFLSPLTSNMSNSRPLSLNNRSQNN